MKTNEDQNSMNSELRRERYPNWKIVLVKIELKTNRMKIQKISLIIWRSKDNEELCKKKIKARWIQISHEKMQILISNGGIFEDSSKIDEKLTEDNQDNRSQRLEEDVEEQ